MSRPPRLTVARGIYHLMARGNRKERIFEDDYDRLRFIAIVRELIKSYQVRIFAEARETPVKYNTRLASSSFHTHSLIRSGFTITRSSA